VAKLAPLVVVVLIAAGCGSGSATKPPASALEPGPGHVVYRGTGWAVVVDGGKAVAQRLVGGAWRVAPAGSVKISVLGPKPGSKGNPATPQVAAELSAKNDLVESALWVDGVELLEKGGGLTPTRGTLYGAPATPLRPGKHTAVAYGRTATHAAAIAWIFSV
jgi:hypothetical protein